MTEWWLYFIQSSNK